MDEVATGLFVGTQEDAEDVSTLEANGIDVIVSLTHTPPDPESSRSPRVVSVPMLDGPWNDRDAFEAAVGEVVACLHDDSRILVHCSAGASRSPAVAATALAITTGRPIETVLTQIEARRETVDLHEALRRRANEVRSSWE